MKNETEVTSLGVGRGERMAVLFSSSNFDGELEATAIKSVLDAEGIPCILSGPQMLPNLAFEVQVPEHLLHRAEQLLRDSRQSGREAADLAEAEFE